MVPRRNSLRYGGEGWPKGETSYHGKYRGKDGIFMKGGEDQTNSNGRGGGGGGGGERGGLGGGGARGRRERMGGGWEGRGGEGGVGGVCEPEKGKKETVRGIRGAVVCGGR